MKRLVNLMTCISLCFSLVGCGSTYSKDAEYLSDDARSVISTKLEIQEGYKDTHDNGYTNIKGRVKNTSSKTISYYEIVCRYRDKNGNLIYSECVKSSLKLGIGELREFEIVHKSNPELKEYELSVQNIR